MEIKCWLDTFVSGRHVHYVILLCCHAEASELSVKSGRLAQKHTESLKPFIQIKQSTDRNLETATKDTETVITESTLTLKEIQNNVQILFKDVTNCKI